MRPRKCRNFGALITCGGVNVLSKVTLLRFLISWKKLIHSSRTGVGSSWSHSNPICYSRCIPILAWTRNAAANPTGSSSRAIWLSIPLLVSFISSGGLNLNIKTSSAWFQMVRSISSSVAPCSSLTSPSDLLSLFVKADLKAILWLEICHGIISYPCQLLVVRPLLQCELNNCKCHHISVLFQHLSSMWIRGLCFISCFS